MAATRPSTAPNRDRLSDGYWRFEKEAKCDLRSLGALTNCSDLAFQRPSV